MRAVFWLLMGAAFAPAFYASVAVADKYLRQGLWDPHRELRSAEVWSPSTGDWAPTGDLLEPAVAPQAVLLRGGDVLEVSSRGDHVVAQRWSAASGEWRAAGSLPYRSQSRLLALLDGRALLWGDAETL